MGNDTDQRRHPRFAVLYGVLAELEKATFGMITDISKGGLAFRYIDNGPGLEPAVLEQTTEVSIMHKAGLFLLNVPCRIIRDDSALPEYFLGSVRMNKCRLEFCKLTPAQTEQLEYFIDRYTDSCP